MGSTIEIVGGQREAQLGEALIAADKAGDKDGAAKLAAALKDLKNSRNLDFEKFTYAPTVGMNAAERTAAGAGKAVIDAYSGGKQLLGLESQSDIQEAQKRDEPLSATTSGKVGNVLGNAALAAPTILIPGVNTAAGAGLVGTGMGALQPVPEGDVASGKLVNAAIGGVAGAGVQGLGQGVAALAKGRVASLEKQATENAVKDATLKTAQDAGYILPPTTTNPTVVNRLVEGLAGKLTTAQQASIRNQETTNNLVRQSLNLPEGAPLTKEALKQIRADAGNAYGDIKNVGTIGTDQRFTTDLANVVQKFKGASKDFPELAKNDVQAIVDSVNKGEFDASSGIDAIAILRERATDAYGKGDKTLGAAYRQASKALEDLIDRNLSARGPQFADMLQNYRDARQMIAKTYSVENALNDATGNVSASKLGSALNRGKPLSGELKTVGAVAQAYPKAVREVSESMPGVSPLDYATAGIASAASGNPAAMASVLTRPGMRSLLLSGPYQKTMGTPNYDPSTLTKLSGPVSENGPLRAFLRSVVPASALETLKQQQ